MPGEVLEHRQHPGVAQAASVRTRVVGDRGGVRTERPVTDDTRAVRGVGDIDDGREVDGDAQAAHLPAPVECDAIHLFGGTGLGQHPGCGLGADETGEPRDPATLLVDADRQRQGTGCSGDVGQRAVGQHRQVGPAADHDAAHVLGVDDRTSVRGVAHPDHQELRELVPGGHRGRVTADRRGRGRCRCRRERIVRSRARGLRHHCRLRFGLVRGRRAPHGQHGDRRHCQQGSRDSASNSGRNHTSRH